MEGVPGRTASSDGLSPSQLRWLESETEVHFFSLYRRGEDGRRLTRQQSALVSLMDKAKAESQLDRLRGELSEAEGEPFFLEILGREEMVDRGPEARPIDQPVVAFQAPLTIAKRSPATGRLFYEESYSHCPRSGRKLERVVAQARE